MHTNEEKVMVFGKSDKKKPASLDAWVRARQKRRTKKKGRKKRKKRKKR